MGNEGRGRVRDDGVVRDCGKSVQLLSPVNYIFNLIKEGEREREGGEGENNTCITFLYHSISLQRLLSCSHIYYFGFSCHVPLDVGPNGIITVAGHKRCIGYG